MNLKLTTLLVALPFLGNAADPPTEGIQFLSVRLREAREQAVKQNKPLVAHFTASWCMPCQWMEKNTFTDYALASFINKEFVAVKIDVDEQSGLQDKEAFQVNYLPTLLVFDAAGELVGRFQESMGPERMLQVLFRYTSPQKRVQQRPASSGPTTPAALTSHLNKPALIPEKVSTPSAPFLSEPVAPIPSPIRTQRFFGVQTGAFSSYENANRSRLDMEKKYQLPSRILEDVQPQQPTFFKVIVGYFRSMEEANLFLAQLQQEGQKGYVRELPKP
ncbi:MAG: thioredoxin family protein [Haliscomenobacter sp.]|nr:thioredoxin family protein [Haliscomenobacter sp.]